MYLKTLDKKDCCGCTACKSICPKKCISMKSDDEGFFYPEVDRSHCIECGLCERVCPMEHPQYTNMENPAVYAAYIKDDNMRIESSSGGLFYAIADWVLEKQGIVYGAAFNSNFKLIHVGIERRDMLGQLKGSKYLQSDLLDTFKEIRKHLIKNRWVYFVGVGCQVAGLKSFLRKNYDTLLTTDLVCHGVPSQLMFDWHLNYLQHKIGGKINSYSFRDCEKWVACESYTYISHDKKKSKSLPSYTLSPYLYSFINSLDLRYSCYSCKFARVPRQGDITLADFWGARNLFPDLKCQKGVSLVLINNAKGHMLWNNIKCTLEWRLSNIHDASKENTNLVCHSSKEPKFRHLCYKLIRDKGYSSVANGEFRPSYYYLKKIYIIFRFSNIGTCLSNCLKLIKKKLN